jgi:multiple sugar transport system permease protein
VNVQQRGWLQKRLGRVFGYAMLILTSLFLISPVFFMSIASFKLDEEYMKYPIVVFPEIWHWENYSTIFELTPFAQIALRTGLLAVGTAALTALVSSLVGYAFARYNVPGSSQLFGIVVAMLIVPFIVILIPQFMIYARLKLTNTYWPWILGALGGTPFYIFMFRQFFLGFPRELEEAAEVDGCGPFRIFLQIFLPNAKPVIATVMIFAIIGVWGDYLTPSIYLSANKTLLGVALATAFKDPAGNSMQTVSLAASVLYIIPLILVFFFGQKYILQGVVTSGLKG